MSEDTPHSDEGAPHVAEDDLHGDLYGDVAESGAEGKAAGDPEGQDLAAQVRALRGDVQLLDELVRDFMDPETSGAGGAQPGLPGQPGAGEEPFEPAYPSLEQWVVDYFAPMFGRPLSPTTRWCAQWWDHAEAISRLEALWRSWEVARLDELRGMAVWYRDFLDSQLAVLLSTGGPFAQCTADRHAPTKALATTLAPEGYWDEPDGEALPADSPYQAPSAEEQEH